MHSDHPRSGVYPRPLLPLMQSLSSTLAHIDSEHERELQKLSRSKADPWLKEQLRRTLAQRHEERREPYVQQLADLRARMRSTSEREPA